nr:rhomboid-related protein 2-like isoform X1 [Leptinotarsa decemlineata]
MSRPSEENIALQEVGQNPDRYRIIFEQCDFNQDGYISVRELVHFLSSDSERCRGLKKNNVRRIHKMADLNGDHSLDFHEFVELMERQDFKDIAGKYFAWYVHTLIPHSQPEAQRARSFRLHSYSTSYEEEEKTLDYSCCPPPIFMVLISALEFALFITDELTQTDSTLTGSGATGKYLLWDPAKKSEFWRYVTYMFVHIGYQHIIVNLIVQIILGVPLEMVNRSWKILHLYFLGGITGCLAHAIIDGNTRLGGASGGVYALLTAHLAQVIMNWKNVTAPFIQFSLFGILIVCDLGTSAYQRYYLNVFTSVGVTCHVGGAVAGFLVGIYTLRNIEITKAEKYFWWIALFLYIILMVVLIVLNVIRY